MLKKFWNKPITWGDYITMGLSLMPITYVITLMSFGVSLCDVWEVTCIGVKELWHDFTMIHSKKVEPEE